jgi:hypothetical protein
MRPQGSSNTGDPGSSDSVIRSTAATKIQAAARTFLAMSPLSIYRMRAMEKKIFALNLALTRANEHNANHLADIQSLHSEVTSLRQTVNVLVSQNAKEPVQRGMSAVGLSEALIIANEHNLKHLAKIQSLQSQNTELIDTMDVIVMGMIAQDDLSAPHGRMHS